MSVESDFFRSSSVFQAGNITKEWALLVPVGKRCLGVSFFPDTTGTLLTNNFLRYERDAQNNTFIHFNMSTGPNGLFFAVAGILTPSA